MQQTKPKLNLWTKNKNAAVTATLSLLMIQIVSGCSSVSPRHEKVSDVLERQNALIGKIKKERTQEEIAAKVAGDPTLAPAEVRLNHALDELTESNVVVQEAVKPKRHVREVMRERY